LAWLFDFRGAKRDAPDSVFNLFNTLADKDSNVRFSEGSIIRHKEWVKDRRARVLANYKEQGQIRVIRNKFDPLEMITDCFYWHDDNNWELVK